jgi:hypothetical protein
MTEDNISNLILDHLRSIRSTLARHDEQFDTLIMRLGSIESQMAGIHADIAGLNLRMDALKTRWPASSGGWNCAMKPLDTNTDAMSFVGWVAVFFGNPTFPDICWVAMDLQPNLAANHRNMATCNIGVIIPKAQRIFLPEWCSAALLCSTTRCVSRNCAPRSGRKWSAVRFISTPS